MTTDSWYALYVITGEESGVAQVVSKVTGITDVCLPVQYVMYRQGGEWHRQERLVFPGYVLIQAPALTAELYHRLTDISGVIRLLGMTATGKLPPPIPSEQMRTVQMLTQDGAAQPIVLEWHKRDGKVVLDTPLPEGVELININVRQRKATAQIRIGELTATIRYPMISNRD